LDNLVDITALKETWSLFHQKTSAGSTSLRSQIGHAEDFYVLLVYIFSSLFFWSLWSTIKIQWLFEGVALIEFGE